MLVVRWCLIHYHLHFNTCQLTGITFFGAITSYAIIHVAFWLLPCNPPRTLYLNCDTKPEFDQLGRSVYPASLSRCSLWQDLLSESRSAIPSKTSSTTLARTSTSTSNGLPLLFVRLQKEALHRRAWCSWPSLYGICGSLLCSCWRTSRLGPCNWSHHQLLPWTYV